MASQVIKITIQACVMSMASNVLAQAITAYKSNSPLVLDWTPIYQFLIFTILSTPPNFLWQQYLEHLLPGQTLVPTNEGVLAASKTGATPAPYLTEKQPNAPLTEPRLNKTNTLLKFVIDQTFCASLNTIGFSAGMAGIKGASTSHSLQIAKQDFWPLMKAGWKLWPFVSAISYAGIKTVEGRQLLGGVAGLAWGVYLSLVNAGQ